MSRMTEPLVLYDGAMLALSLKGGGDMLRTSDPATDGALEVYSGRPRMVDNVDAASRLCLRAIPLVEKRL